MKVLCVSKDHPEHWDPELAAASKKLQVGSEYTVVDEDETHYELEEFPHPGKIMWLKSCFAPLTGIDESELINQQLQTA